MAGVIRHGVPSRRLAGGEHRGRQGEAGGGFAPGGSPPMLAASSRPRTSGAGQTEAPRPGPGGIIGLAVILGVLAGAYFLFPVLQRSMSYQDCIASGRITGC